MNLHESVQSTSNTARTRRVGRGVGSHRGAKSGRGSGGQKSRAGGNIPARFEGGQMPLTQRLPKRRGFRRPNRPKVFTINLTHLHRFLDGKSLTTAYLREKGYIEGSETVKILGDGELKDALTIETHAISASARQKIENAGGQITIIDPNQRLAPEPKAKPTKTEA